MTNQQIDDFANRGFFYAEEATPKSMVADLLAAVRRVKQKVRDKEVEIYTHRTDSEEPWAIRGLFAPEFEEPIFSEYLMCKEIRQTVHHFLGDQLKLGTVLIFTNPHDQDCGFGWHRDFGKLPRDADEEEELDILHRPQKSLKWHLALVDDACLQLVPGSHTRYRTDYEQECLRRTRNGDIPGQKTIYLTAGQTVFWHGYTIHRGVMKKDVERLTLAGSWAKYDETDESQEVDKRLRWMLAENVRPALPEAMKPLYDRWRSQQIDTERQGEDGTHGQ